MPANDTPLSVYPVYNPPDYLVSSTGLSREDLIRQFEGFCESANEDEVSPALVFERLIGNMRESVNKALTEERARHAKIEEAWHREKISFQSKIDCTTDTVKDVEPVYFSSPVSVPAQISPVVANQHIYLQFWFTRVNPHNSSQTGVNPSNSSRTISSTRIRAATTTTPAPYSIAAGWPDMDHLASSVNHGSYDTRMDPLITTSTIPSTLTHIVTFEKPFANPPQVLVWLTGLSATTGAAVCVRAVANNITESEFTLQITSGEVTGLGSVGAAWAVWPEARSTNQDGGYHQGMVSAVQVGSVSTVTPGGARVRVLSKSGSVGGEIRMAGISTVDLVLAGGLWVELVVEGRGWSMTAGPADASVYAARVAYAFT